MAQAILLRGARQLLTLRGPRGVRRGSALNDLGLIEDGSVLIRDGMIVAIGTSRRVENLAEARKAIEVAASGQIVMPGLVDPIVNIAVRQSDTSPGAPVKHKKSVEVHDETISLLQSCLRHGTVAAQLTVDVDDVEARSRLAVLRQLARVGDKPVRTVRTCRVSGGTNPGDASAREFAERLRVLARNHLIQYVALKAGSESVPGDSLILSAAEQARVGVKLLWHGGSPEYLAQLMHRFNFVTVCCPSHLGAIECSIPPSATSIVVLSLGKAVLEAEGEQRVRQTVDAGGALALSTGYDARRTPTFSMQLVVALAVMRMGLTVEEAISLATINAAYATGCGGIIGSIEVGKRADLLVLNLADYREIPRQFGINHVATVIRDGEVVVGGSGRDWGVGAA